MWAVRFDDYITVRCMRVFVFANYKRSCSASAMFVRVCFLRSTQVLRRTLTDVWENCCRACTYGGKNLVFRFSWKVDRIKSFSKHVDTQSGVDLFLKPSVRQERRHGASASHGKPVNSAAFNSTQCAYPQRMARLSWPGGWLHFETVYPPADDYPS